MRVPRQRATTAIERAVEAAGQAWALDWINMLRDEGRAIAGGWPGTIREARQRVAMCATGANGSLGHEELEALTRRAYDVAAETWLARAQSVKDD
jgi:hypothetical protein